MEIHVLPQLIWGKKQKTSRIKNQDDTNRPLCLIYKFSQKQGSSPF